jgi:peptidoglycan L-alanyl-D-glutamate endopeptidase CwlK
MFELSPASKEKLIGVNPKLVKVVELAIQRCPVDFKVIDGVRTQTRQQELFNQGKSRTLKSKHIVGKAVDVVALINGKTDWSWKYYEIIAETMKQAAKDLDTPIEWGGDWATFRDGVHFQLKD